MATQDDAQPVTSQDAPAPSQATTQVPFDEAWDEADLEAEVRLLLEID